MDESPILVMEGGAMRGLFTAGVLDAFMDHHFYFPKVVGISAGTLQGLGYLSRQCGRSVRVNSTYAADPRYMGVRHIIHGGSFFNFDFMFGELAHEADPFDEETFTHAKEELYAVITDCWDGKPHFVSSHNRKWEDYVKVCEASCSIPLVSKPVPIEGNSYVDGGVGLPLVPLPEEIPFSHGKIVYILTRDITYRKKPVPFWLHGLLNRVYGKKFPAVVEGMCSIPERYNKKVDRVIELEKEGKVFVIRPEKPVTVTRIERDAGKLRALHGEGYRIGMDRFDEMMRWLHDK
ncbi:patatin family protein [uncultured Dialister sp.]|jgi:predicted patatin/cPLA2 family phospholipase|uniref:patatin-like phospholipase family protein n=1 Tax=uncultured Dialister sp. TaxID=278064 RepID=UPI0025F00157|nr:patatin family protein [uncultured Dialister sp.]